MDNYQCLSLIGIFLSAIGAIAAAIAAVYSYRLAKKISEPNLVLELVNGIEKLNFSIFNNTGVPCSFDNLTIWRLNPEKHFLTDAPFEEKVTSLKVNIDGIYYPEFWTFRFPANPFQTLRGEVLLQQDDRNKYFISIEYKGKLVKSDIINPCILSIV